MNYDKDQFKKIAESRSTNIAGRVGHLTHASGIAQFLDGKEWVDATKAHLDATKDLNKKLKSLDFFLSSALLDPNLNPNSFTKDCLCEAIEELYKLSSTELPNYDLPEMGRCYTSWYHLCRVRTAFDGFFLAKESLNINSDLKEKIDNNDPLRVVDLGCGTGAAAWALSSLGWNIDQYIGLDSSSTMLDWAKILCAHNSDWKKVCSIYEEWLGSGLSASTPVTLNELSHVSLSIHSEWRKKSLQDVISDGFDAEQCDILILPHFIDDGVRATLDSSEGQSAISFNKAIEELNPATIIISTVIQKDGCLADILVYLNEIDNYKLETRGLKFPDQIANWEALPLELNPDFVPRDEKAKWCTNSRILWACKLGFVWGDDCPKTRPVTTGDTTDHTYAILHRK